MRWLVLFLLGISSLSAQNWVDYDDFNNGSQDTAKWNTTTEGGDANITFEATQVRLHGSGIDEPYSSIDVKIDNRTFTGIRAKLKLDSTTSNQSEVFISLVLGRFYADLGIAKKADGSVVIYHEVEEDVTEQTVSSGEQSASTNQYYDLAITYTTSQVNFLLNGAVIASYSSNGLIPFYAQIGAELEENVNGSYLAYTDDVQLYQGTATYFTVYDTFGGTTGAPNSSYWTTNQGNGGNAPTVADSILTLSGTGSGEPYSDVTYSQSLSSAEGFATDILISSTSDIGALGGLGLDVNISGTNHVIFWEIEKTGASTYNYIAEIEDASSNELLDQVITGASADVYTHLAVEFVQDSTLVVNFYAAGELLQSYDFGSVSSWNVSSAKIEGLHDTTGSYLFQVAGSYIDYDNPSSYSIMLDSSSNGTVSPSSSVNAATAGADYTFTITPDSGYKIDSITTSSGSVSITNENGMSYTFSNVQKIDNIDVSFGLIGTVPRYCLYNPNNGFHFWTINTAEDFYLGSIGWNQEGANYRMYSSAGTVDSETATAYYRLYNPNSGRHFWTSNSAEDAYLGGIGWNQEGINGYLFLTSVTGSMPIYRLYNPNSGGHFWTVNEAEYIYLGSIGWNQEGIAGYVFSN